MTSDSVLFHALCDFDPDSDHRPAIALQVDVAQSDAEQPVHRHRKGQLVMALRGAVLCEAPGALWLVPPQHAVWIPGDLPHSNRVTDNARICFLFVEPGAAPMPEGCCTLAIHPMLREMIAYVADQGLDYPHTGPTARLVAVLLEQLAQAPVEQLHLPVSEHPKIRQMAAALAADPSDRRTLTEWSQALAMGERSLARLVQRETGLTFGRWRQQLHLIIALRQLAGGASVQQVAGDLGYDSVTAFITMFKKTMGVPPTRYFAALQ